MEKRIPKRGLLYILKGADCYKIGCCLESNIKRRLRYWNNKYNENFSIYFTNLVKDMYKEENDCLRYLRGQGKRIPNTYELFFDCDDEIIYLIKKYNND